MIDEANPYRPPEQDFSHAPPPGSDAPEIDPRPGRYAPGAGAKRVAEGTFEINLLINVCAVGVLGWALYQSLTVATPTEAEAQALDNAFNGTWAIVVLCVAVSVIPFCIWFHRVYANLSALRAPEIRRQPTARFGMSCLL